MLRFRISGNDKPRAFSSSATGWRRLESWVEPLRVPALEDFAVRAEDCLLIVVRERVSGIRIEDGRDYSRPIKDATQQQLSAALDEMRDWPLDFLALTVTCLPHETTVELLSGIWGTCPVYLVTGASELWGDWDSVELYRRLSRVTLNEERAAHFLVSFGSPYSKETIIPDLVRATAASRVRWTASDARLRADYPTPGAEPHPRCLKPDADVLGAFRTALSASMARYIDDDTGVSAFLSGGLDSGIVAATAAPLVHQPVRTYGLLMPGEAAAGQARRRAEFIQQFGFSDAWLEAAAYPALGPESSRIRELRIIPWEECYYEAFEALLRLAARDGHGLLFTGNGGDELCYLYWTELSEPEREARLSELQPDRSALPDFLTSRVLDIYSDTVLSIDRAPRSALPMSGLSASASVAPLFARNGIWPVSPLCTPELYRFCRSLPREWRDGRELPRRFLKQLGCTPEVTHPRSTEDFMPMLELSLRRAGRPLLDRLFCQPRLADLGLVDGIRLRAAYGKYCEGDPLPYDPVHFYAAAVLELTLLSMEARAGGLSSDNALANLA
jgi:asparagine synthase (glutamine-hydrolysing)